LVTSPRERSAARPLHSYPPTCGGNEQG
jgi:hypothetical protein